MSYVKQEKSDFIRHAPCPDCASKDNLAIYTNHTYCFGCHTHKFTNQNTETAPVVFEEKEKSDMIEGINEALPSRKIDSDTCRIFIMRLVLIMESLVISPIISIKITNE